jgi:hypothetical protein
LVVGLGLAFPASAQTSPYQLVAGDVVEIVYAGAVEPMSAMVDIDGNIRLPGLRGVAIAGQTLDEAELFLEQSLSDAGLYVDPRISISIARYAQIIVVGDVSNQGFHDFFPGMTVSAALGLAGGRAADGPSELDLSRAETDARIRLQQAAVEIADATVKLAGLEAFLAGSDTISLDPAQIQTLPRGVHEQIPDLISAETLMLEAKLERQHEMLRIWATEIEGMEAQSALSTERLDLQDRVVANLEVELEASQTLVERGLQTANRLSEISQRDANARARALEIESAKILLDRSIADAALERFSFTSLQRQEALREHRSAQLGLEKARLNYSREVETLSTLSRASPVSALADDTFLVLFEIISPRLDRSGTGAILRDTALLPGDTLIVTLAPIDQLTR